ncbi:MAG: tRNA 2-thiouridine(34) synthase MnmA [Candidatus Nomurabacteria bacterium]|nr:MAG: tRNA 2-thiouridine(34) synthase MnmA [Candidatus Nomurabacteria bacterium]
MTKKKKIAVGMSGGVDSSVAALLLRDQGYDITGVFMKNWTKSKISPYCSEEADRKDAVRVATQLGIPFEVWDFEEEYRQRVMDIFFAEYAAGRTPNPDILCNKEIKFGLFLQRALAEGYDAVATGHYARVRHDADGSHLLQGLDSNKDQSYFLMSLDQRSLPYAFFPIGEYTKPEVRKMAREAGLRTAEKKDSQGICFVGPVNIAEFLQTRLHKQPGEVITPEGKVIGQHQGSIFATIGQREGLGVSGTGIPYYVAVKDTEHNRLIAVQGNKHPLLYSTWLSMIEPSWTMREPEFPYHCQARIRYRQPAQDCVIEKQDGHLRVSFTTAQRAVTPGQFIVFYQGDELIGGGIIEASEAMAELAQMPIWQAKTR